MGRGPPDFRLLGYASLVVVAVAWCGCCRYQLVSLMMMALLLGSINARDLMPVDRSTPPHLTQHDALNPNPPSTGARTRLRAVLVAGSRLGKQQAVAAATATKGKEEQRMAALLPPPPQRRAGRKGLGLLLVLVALLVLASHLTEAKKLGTGRGAVPTSRAAGGSRAGG